MSKSTLSSSSLAVAGATTLPPPPPQLFSEDVLLVLLQNCSPTRSRVEALARLCLQHLPQCEETWAALRKALVEQQDLSSAANKGLWCLLDALLKGAPAVFVPLAAPRLLEYVRQQMPWASLDWAAHTGGLEPHRLTWCEELVGSWRGLLPPRVLAPILQHAVQCRSEAELGGALSADSTASPTPGAAADKTNNDNNNNTTTKTAAAAAASASAAGLISEWKALRFWCAAELQRAQREAIAAAGQRKRRREAETNGDDGDEALEELMLLSEAGNGGRRSSGTGLSASAAAGRTNSKNNGNNVNSNDGSGEDEEEEEEYEPDYVSGATREGLPDLGIKMKRQRRDARNRPRDDMD